MNFQESKIHSRLAASQVRPFQDFNVEHYTELSKLGIEFSTSVVNSMIATMDSIQPSVTTGSMSTPVQFLQSFLPGFVNIITGARKIDEIVGIATVGSWEDYEIIQGVMDLLGTSVPYGDYTNIPLSSWNLNWDRRSIVQFEEGMHVGSLEEARAARVNVNSGAYKREAAGVALEIRRNNIGFNGYNSGNNRTYGFLNDPALIAYTTVATGASGSTLWANKTYLEITKDIRVAMATVRIQSQDTVDPKTTPTTLAISTDAVDYLSTVSEFGNSVQQWLNETYPKCRVVSAPELNNANGGANVFYLFADRIQDNSTDGGQVFLQAVPAKFRLLGVQKLVKGYQEAYSNATAGVYLKRAFAVTRWSGI